MTKETLTPMTVPANVRRRAGLLLAGVALAAVLLALPPAASADFGLVDGTFAFDPLRADGSFESQAGAHPHSFTTTFKLNTVEETNPNPLPNLPPGIYPDGNAKTVAVTLPPGFVGNPQATVRCTRAQFNAIAGGSGRCPVQSQIGVVALDLHVAGASATIPYPLWNVEPREGEAADIGLYIQAAPLHLVPRVDSAGNYALTIDSKSIPTAMQLSGQTATLWGVPHDSSHDLERACVSDPQVLSCEARPLPGPHRPFLTSATSCSGPLTSRMRIASWQRPDDFKHAEYSTASGLDGCESVPFEPSIEVATSSTEPDAPTGLTVEVRTPQSDDPDGIGQAHLERAVVTLPEGMTLNPAAADGLQACSDAEIGFGSDAPARCPLASKVGTVAVETPLLTEPLTGSVFVGAQQPGDPYRMFVEAEGPGVRIKLRGSIAADPATGRLTTTIANAPQLPFETFRMQFKGGPRAPLANPTTCGPKTVTTVLTPWSGTAPATPSDGFAIDCPGVSGFAPAFSAGVLEPIAGFHSPFVARFDRPDGQQYLDDVDVELPPGLLAKLKGTPLCGDADAAAGSCPPASRVGTATVGAGAGATPFFLKGSVSLTKGYRGAPYGLSVSVRAIAGPYDLGTVVVRQALFVDPDDAHVTVDSDPLPKILEGIPLRLRTIQVDVDRPGFALTPTDCSPKRIDAALRSVDGARASLSGPFQVGECAALSFGPKLALALKGRKQVRTGKHPAVHATVRQRAGAAAIERAVVRLPRSLALDPANAQALCEFADGTRPDVEQRCPKGSIVGRAKAVSPLLERPLTGNVYFVKNVARSASGNTIRKLPMLVVALRGEIAINLRGASSTTRDGRLVSTFASVPDAPVSRFDLDLAGGRNGILTVTRTARARINLCSKPRGHVAAIELDGHNGKQRDFATRVKTPCR